MAVAGDRIRDARERLGLTQDQLAELVGAHRTSVLAWEKGTPPRNRLGKLREVLGLDENLLPLSTATTEDPGRLGDTELVSRLHMLLAQATALAAEISRRSHESGVLPSRPGRRRYEAPPFPDAFPANRHRGSSSGR